MSSNINSLISQTRIIPVLVINRLENAVPLAKTLVESGMKVLEITLRTPVALDAIKSITENLPEAVAGAGTVTCEAQINACIQSGAKFIFTPGASPALLETARQAGIPFVPGVSSVSEVMTAMEYGFNTFKLFPAEAVGGIQWLKAVSGPLPEARFCPTGGIGSHNYKDYLALNNVIAVGGSWLAPTNLVDSCDWQGIKTLCNNA